MLCADSNRARLARLGLGSDWCVTPGTPSRNGQGEIKDIYTYQRVGQGSWCCAQKQNSRAETKCLNHDRQPHEEGAQAIQSSIGRARWVLLFCQSGPAQRRGVVRARTTPRSTCERSLGPGPHLRLQKSQSLGLQEPLPDGYGAGIRSHSTCSSLDAATGGSLRLESELLNN